MVGFRALIVADQGPPHPFEYMEAGCRLGESTFRGRMLATPRCRPQGDSMFLRREASVRVLVVVNSTGREGIVRRVELCTDL